MDLWDVKRKTINLVKILVHKVVAHKEVNFELHRNNLYHLLKLTRICSDKNHMLLRNSSSGKSLYRNLMCNLKSVVDESVESRSMTASQSQGDTL